MGSVIQSLGPTVDQALVDSTVTVVNNIEVTINAAVGAAYVGYGGQMLAAASATVNGFRSELNLNGVVITRSRRHKYLGTSGGRSLSAEGWILLQGLNPGDVLTLSVREEGSGIVIMPAGESWLDVLAFGPEIRVGGILEDTG